MADCTTLHEPNTSASVLLAGSTSPASPSTASAESTALPAAKFSWRMKKERHVPCSSTVVASTGASLPATVIVATRSPRSLFVAPFSKGKKRVLPASSTSYSAFASTLAALLFFAAAYGTLEKPGGPTASTHTLRMTQSRPEPISANFSAVSGTSLSVSTRSSTSGCRRLSVLPGRQLSGITESRFAHSRKFAGVWCARLPVASATPSLALASGASGATGAGRASGPGEAAESESILAACVLELGHSAVCSRLFLPNKMLLGRTNAFFFI